MDLTPCSIALAGIGKIACDAHVPALNGSADGVDGYEDIDSFLDARPDVDTVSLALPPGPRYDYAAQAMRAGRNVMLEKPPGPDLVGMRGAGGSRTRGRCHLFARAGIRGWAAPSARPLRGFGARRSGGFAWTGGRTCAKATRDKTGFGSPVPGRL